MAVQHIGRYADAQVVIPSTATATDPPDADTDRFDTRAFAGVTTFLAYSGSVTGTLRLWVHDGEDWFKGGTLALSSSGGNIAYDWDTGTYRQFTFQVESISGGGTVSVKVEGF